MKRKLENIEAGGQIISDWELYNIPTDHPYINLKMVGLDGKEYTVTADIVFVEEGGGC